MKKLILLLAVFTLFSCDDQLTEQWQNDFVFFNVNDQSEILVADKLDIDSAKKSTNNTESNYLISATEIDGGLEVIFYREAGYDVVYFSGYEVTNEDEQQPWRMTTKKGKQRIFIPDSKLKAPEFGDYYYFMVSNNNWD